MTNSTDPNQLANRFGSTLFAKTGHVVFSKRMVNWCNPRLMKEAFYVFFSKQMWFDKELETLQVWNVYVIIKITELIAEKPTDISDQRRFQ